MSRKSINQKNHWWESYIIRYALGAIIGSICVYFLLNNIYITIDDKCGQHNTISSCENNIERCIKLLNVALLNGNLNDNDLGIPQYILLLIYGLCFSYVASAPGLVFHVMRYKICKKYLKLFGNKSNKTTIYSIKILIFLLIFLSSVGYSYFFYFDTWFFIISILIFGWLFVVQAHYLINTPIYLIQFYHDLKKARDGNIIDKESYQHLREHGNAFLIIIFEAFLTAFLYDLYLIFCNYRYLLMALIVWILPAAFVYLIAYTLEFQMVYNYQNKNH
ncbi:MAG: hypothetical protein J1E80_03195 [Desulfovibrionaceae bacterium]|nr:hypothetical protein [Desulfovibrionaceae bacterium]